MTRRILTADDVAALPVDQALHLDENTTLTGAARDLARRRGIELVEHDGAADAGARGGRTVPGASGVEDPPRGDHATVASAASSAPNDVPAGRPGRLIVTAVGSNRPGILAELTAAVGQLGGDIQDLSQRITGGYFHAILVIDIERSGQHFSAYRDALLTLSEPSDYVVTVVDERVFRAMHRL